MAEQLKLNLGSGKTPKAGYVNVDKYGNPDLVHDLEEFPWPWETSSAGEVVLRHVLEHLGQTPELFLGVMRELYRVCAPGALIHIAVPHPRHDDFINDPTHIRAITPELMMLFSKVKNREWAQLGAANSPLALYIDVDFELVSANLFLEEPWFSQLASRKISQEDVQQAMRQFNNVAKEIRMVMRAIKPDE